MSDCTVEWIDITPYFDWELVMRKSQGTRLGRHGLERMMQLWEECDSLLQVRVLDTGKVKYLAVWLDASVEDKIDTSWAESPSQAYQDNALAQTLCMSAVHSLLPEIEDAGCAPAPRPTDKLRAALEEAGLPYKAEGPVLSRRFAVLTHYPFTCACEICHLQGQCPKGQGQAGASSVVLPGYEQA